MDYNPPAFCIRSSEPAEVAGRFNIDMPSLWREPGQLNVDQATITAVTVGKYKVPKCPPGYPNPPEEDLNN